MTLPTNEQSAYARWKKNREMRLWWEFLLLPHARLMEYLRHPDPMKRIVAARHLCGCDGKAAFRRCLKLGRGKDPVLREHAVEFLGNCVFPDTEEGGKAKEESLALLRALAKDDPRARVRARAVRALERRAAAEVKPKKFWGPPQSAYERRKEKRELRFWAECKKAPHARLIACLRDPAPMKRSVAVSELHIRNSKAALRDALRLCRSEDPILRENGALTLGQLQFPGEEADRETGGRVAALLHELAIRDPKARVRAGALCALGHRATRGGDHALILNATQAGARDASSAVRYSAAFALGYINLPGAEKALLPLLRDPKPEVRDWAAFVIYMGEEEEALVYDTPEIREALLELAVDPDWEVRYEAFRALGALREKRAAPMLARELNNAEVLYFDLARAAGRIGDPALIPVLERALERFDDDKDILKTALEALREKEVGSDYRHARP